MILQKKKKTESKCENIDFAFFLILVGILKIFLCGFWCFLAFFGGVFRVFIGGFLWILDTSFSCETYFRQDTHPP